MFLLSVSTGHPEVERSCVYTASSQHLLKRREVYAATNSLCCADGTAGRNHRLFGAEEGKGAWLVAITMLAKIGGSLGGFSPHTDQESPTWDEIRVQPMVVQCQGLKAPLKPGFFADDLHRHECARILSQEAMYQKPHIQSLCFQLQNMF